MWLVRTFSCDVVVASFENQECSGSALYERREILHLFGCFGGGEDVIWRLGRLGQRIDNDPAQHVDFALEIEAMLACGLSSVLSRNAVRKSSVAP